MKFVRATVNVPVVVVSAASYRRFGGLRPVVRSSNL